MLRVVMIPHRSSLRWVDSKVAFRVILGNSFSVLWVRFSPDRIFAGLRNMDWISCNDRISHMQGTHQVRTHAEFVWDPS